jgi:hypothetical protein
MSTSRPKPVRSAACLAAVAVAAAVATTLGCGEMDPGTTVIPGCTAAAGAMLPWKAGNTWTYQVNDEGVMSPKITTIGDQEPVGGTGPNKDVMAYKVVTKKSQMDQTVSWQGPMGDNIVRYREQAFSMSTGALEIEEHWDPHKLHIDGTTERRVTNATWLEIFHETKLQVGLAPEMHEAHDRWTILSACEPVTVPAGTFTAVSIRKVSATGGSAKQYWYVPGVGKVKESGGQLEELVSYSLVP